MPISAPLRVTAEIVLQRGPAPGERFFRLSERLELPAALHFPLPLPLPVEGASPGRLRLRLPTGQLLDAAAQLESDPERPERGSLAQLPDLTPSQVQAIERYIEQRMVDRE